MYQLGWATLRDAICTVAQIAPGDFHQVYLKHSDVGETAFEIFSHRPVVTPLLSIRSVLAAFVKLQAARGPTMKLPLLIQVLQQCSPLEAKFLVKILTSDLRIGLKEGLVEDAIAQAFNAPAEQIREANLLLGHAGETAQLARQNRLSSASMVPFRPVKFMLFAAWSARSNGRAVKSAMEKPWGFWVERFLAAVVVRASSGSFGCATRDKTASRAAQDDDAVFKVGG